jgi:hypothetical protein
MEVVVENMQAINIENMAKAIEQCLEFWFNKEKCYYTILCLDEKDGVLPQFKPIDTSIGIQKARYYLEKKMREMLTLGRSVSLQSDYGAEGLLKEALDAGGLKTLIKSFMFIDGKTFNIIIR